MIVGPRSMALLCCAVQKLRCAVLSWAELSYDAEREREREKRKVCFSFCAWMDVYENDVVQWKSRKGRDMMREEQAAGRG